MITVATSGARIRQQTSLGLMALNTQEEVENGEGILDRLCIGSCVVKKDVFLKDKKNNKCKENAFLLLHTAHPIAHQYMFI